MQASETSIGSIAVDPARLKAIVFDVDGTLYRQSPLRRAMLLRLIQEAAVKPASAVATFRALRAYRRAQEHLRDVEVDGILAVEHLRLASARSGQTEQVVAQIVARWMDLEPLTRLARFVEPGLLKLLDAARSRGLRLGVFSDYPAAAKLEAMGLTKYFDVVVAAQDAAVNRFKPNPSGIIETLRRLETSAAHALYVGDRRDVDGPAARAAGVPCVIIGRRGEPNVAEGWIPVSDYSNLRTMLFSSESESLR